jgi:ATP-dependent DNA helicase RecG
MTSQEFKIGHKYTPRQLMELEVLLMEDSIPEHTDRSDPKVGAVLAKEDGTLVNFGSRGELRQGDHAEFTVLERKHRPDLLQGMVIYATLEPCAPGARSITKLGCAERIVNARLKKAYIGIEDPDPKVKGNGIAHLKKHHIEIDFFDKDLQDLIFEANGQFLKEAEERAKLAESEELDPTLQDLNSVLQDFDWSDFSVEALEKFRENLQINYPIASAEFLSIFRKWSFVRVDDKSKVARPSALGILLFGKNPQIPFPQSLVKFTVETQNEGNPQILDFDGPLVLMPEKIESFLQINFPKTIDRSSFAHREIKQIHFEVLREVILNAITHRDYTIEGANINVRIDDEKIIVESPGKPLIALEKLQNFTAPTFSVNAKIANVFYQMKFIEKRNIGMRELHAYSKAMGLNKPMFEFNEPYLVVTLWKRGESKSAPAKEEVMTFVKANQKVSSGDFVEKFGGSTKTASRYLNMLVDEGLLGREGEKKGTKYFITP